MPSNRGWFISVNYKASGDESSDETKTRVFAIGLVIGTEAEWEAVEGKWLERTGGKVFHAADCETDHGDYERSPHKDNLALYKDLTGILASSSLYALGKGIALTNFWTHFPDAVRDQPYYFCFTEILNQCVEVVSLCIPCGKLEVLFDQHPETEHTAGLIYDAAANDPNWKETAMLADKVSFGTRETVSIQVADLVARETMKHLDNTVGPVKRPIRKSMEALIGTGRFRFQLFTEAFFIDLKRKVSAMPQHGAMWDGFRKWREETGNQDNASTRFRYARIFRESGGWEQDNEAQS